MSSHSCAEWLALRISCPEGLLAQARGKEDGGGAVGDKLLAEPSDDEVIHERTKEDALVPKDGFEIEREVLIELNRRVQAANEKKTPRERTVDALKSREQGRSTARPKVPVSIIQEAIRQGSRNPELGLWVAAASLLLAAGSQRAAVMGVVRGVISSVRGVRARSGGVGFRFNAASQLSQLMQAGAKRLQDSERTGAGEFFSGTEG